VNFDRRNLLYLAVNGAALLCVGAAIIHAFATFVVMIGLAWGLGLPTQGVKGNALQLAGLALGSCVALAELTIFSASSNNLVLYIVVISTLVGTVAYIGTRFPAVKPAQGLFIISMLVPNTVDFRPLPSVSVLFPMFASMWLGVLVSTIVFVIFRCAEDVENVFLRWGRAEDD
jgi:hypothetical protein